MRAFLPFLLIAGVAPPAAAMTVDEVRELLLAGVDEDTVREQVLAEAASFRLGADDLLALHRAGASPGFLQFLIRRRPAAPEAETPALEKAAGPEPAGRFPGDAGRLRREARGDGRTVVVLTNLDAAGNPLPDSPGEPDWIRITARAEEESEGAPPSGGAAGEAAPLVQVVVNPPAESPAPAIPYPLFSPYPLVLTGGLVGSFDFPDRLPFLGYTANDFPKTFTGMGMPLFNDQRSKAKDKQD